MNKEIIASAFVIGGAGVANGLIQQKPITKVLIGDFVFLLMLSIVDMFGGPFSSLSSALALLASLVTVLTVIPWQQILKAIGA